MSAATSDSEDGFLSSGDIRSMIANVDRAYESLSAMVCDLGDAHHNQVDPDDVLAAYHCVFIIRNELHHAAGTGRLEAVN